MLCRSLYTVLLLCWGFSLYGLQVNVNNTTNRVVYVKFAGNNLVVDNTDEVIQPNSNQPFNLTSVSSGRIYLSYDVPLSSNAPDGANPSDPDYAKRFDKIELTYANGAGMANLTAVDFYAIPFLLQTEIQNLIVNQFTLDPKTTGTELTQAILGLSSKTTKSAIKNSNEIVRVLSPVKAPTGYKSLQSYITSTLGSSLEIKGNYFSSNGYIPYDYTGSISADAITLAMSGNQTLTIPTKELVNIAGDVNSNAIYTCNGVYYLSGSGTAPHYVSENDFYAAVYRDVISGYNFGYIGGKYGNNSLNWWGNLPYASANTNYNLYADVVNRLYPGAYGFPFSDRQKNLLADLGGMVDALTITVLQDNAVPPVQPIPGVLNPQTGSVVFNAVLISENDIQDAPFTFGGNQMKAGWINNYHGGPQTNLKNGKAAQIQSVNAQDGYNRYELVFGRNKYTVIVRVVIGKITIATIAGGGNANWALPNLFIGGLQTN
ncbi:MAG: beta-1,3-glucanase family protein [Parachlamydiaceae bacterium]